MASTIDRIRAASRTSTIRTIVSTETPDSHPDLTLSLLIPAYNAEERLPALLADAQAQEPPFSEILVYDDASTDATVAVAASHGATRVLRGETNLGAAHARNQLINAACGDWLHFHDADDRLAAGYTAAMIACSPQPDEIILTDLTTRWIAIDGSESITRQSYSALNGVSDPAMLLDFEFQIGCGLYPARLTRTAGGFNASLRGAEDHDFHMRLLLAGGRFRSLSQSFNTYMVREGQGWARQNEARLRADWLRLLQHYAETLPDHCRSRLGRLAMENAYKLYQCGQRDLAAEAVALARRMGRRQVASSHAWLVLLSSLTGPWPIFWWRTRQKPATPPAPPPSPEGPPQA